MKGPRLGWRRWSARRRRRSERPLFSRSHRPCPPGTLLALDRLVRMWRTLRPFLRQSRAVCCGRWPFPGSNRTLCPRSARRVKLYRAMKADANGRPVCEDSARGLGVRVPRDIICSDSGTVMPRTGGMSVAPEDPKHLAPHRRPPSLGGVGQDQVFMAGRENLLHPLAYRPDPARPTEHGFVEPDVEMHISSFRVALCDTRPSWRLLP